MTFTLDRAWNPLRCRVAIFLASAAPNTSFATADVASRIGKTLTPSHHAWPRRPA